MKQNPNDSDRIEDLNARLRKIPGLLDTVVAQLNGRHQAVFGHFGPTMPDNIQLWLNCRSRDQIWNIPVPSPVAPVRHEQADGCVTYLSLVVRRVDIPSGNPGCVVALRPSEVPASDSLELTRAQLAGLSIIHEDFKPARMNRR